MSSKAAFSTIAMASPAAGSCDQDAAQKEPIGVDPLPDGAYLLSNVTITENSETTVTTREQIKIYTHGRFMYAFDNQSTGDMDVGAGNAVWSNGIMNEEPRVDHDGPVSGCSFDIAINKTETGFEQILHGMKYDDGRVLDTMVEVWDLASSATTPFDGLWKLESRETDDPALTEFSETKMIGGGHFAVLQSAMFEGKKIRNFGFGAFELSEDGRVLETGMVGSWDNYKGWATKVKIELTDENRLTQFIIINDTVVTQTYIRM